MPVQGLWKNLTSEEVIEKPWKSSVIRFLFSAPATWSPDIVERLMVPISNGRNWRLEVAHEAIRFSKQPAQASGMGDGSSDKLPGGTLACPSELRWCRDSQSYQGTLYSIGTKLQANMAPNAAKKVYIPKFCPLFEGQREYLDTASARGSSICCGVASPRSSSD